MEKMYADLKGDINDLKGDINGLKDGQDNLKKGQDDLSSRSANVETEVKKNSVSLESIENKINTVAEVQTAHKEQNELSFKNSDAMVNEHFDLVETALKSTTQDVKESKETIEAMKDIIGHHQVDIEILKRRPV